MNSTGFKDKDGYPINEGDILEGYDGHVHMGDSIAYDGYRAVQWRGWKCGDLSLMDIWADGYCGKLENVKTRCKVIGCIAGDK